MGRLKKVILDTAKKNAFLRKCVRGLRNFKRKIRYKINSRGIKVDEKLIIFTSFNGKSYSCSPKAIYEEMLRDKKFEDYKFVWGFKEVEEHKWLENNRDTKVVKFMSKEYQK